MEHPENPLFGFTINDIVAICGVDVTTARRWKKRAKRAICPPPWALALLTGDLGFLDRTWRGWRIEHGKIVSPEHWRFTTGELLATRFLASQLALYQSENRALKAQLDAEEIERYEEQPTPDSWDVQILTG